MVDEWLVTDRKSISIEIGKGGTLIVRLPKGMPKDSAVRFITSKESWIKKKQTEAKNKKKEVIKNKFVDGELFFYLGDYYKLEIVAETDQRWPLTFDGKVFRLREDYQKRGKEVFLKWYKKQAKRIIEKRVEEFALNYDFNYVEVKVNSAVKRFGSCTSKKTLNFTWRLVMAPQEVLDYVVVHELSHLKNMNHSAKFWNLVASIMPDYKEQEAWLRRNSHLLDVIQED